MKTLVIIIGILAAIACLAVLVTGCDTTDRSIQKGDKGHCDNVAVGYTPCISKVQGGFWGTMYENMFTYTGILDGSFVITGVNWVSMGETSTHPVMYVPHDQTGFTLWDGNHWIHVTNITVGQESAMSFDWEVIQ